MKRFAYDLELCRLGCGLLQATLGGDIAAANEFPTESWLLALTPDLHVYNILDEDLAKAVKLAWLYVHKKVAFPEPQQI